MTLMSTPDSQSHNQGLCIHSSCWSTLPRLVMQVWKERSPEPPAPQLLAVPATPPTTVSGTHHHLPLEMRPESSNFTCFCFLHNPQGEKGTWAQSWGVLTV